MHIHINAHIYFKPFIYILWHENPLLRKDREVSNDTTAPQAYFHGKNCTETD
jgi:hypothetical protein